MKASAVSVTRAGSGSLRLDHGPVIWSDRNPHGGNSFHVPLVKDRTRNAECRVVPPAGSQPLCRFRNRLRVSARTGLELSSPRERDSPVMIRPGALDRVKDPKS